MFRTTTGWVVSPTDLVDTLECDHRSALKAALAARVEGAPAPEPVDPLVAHHGHLHEQAELERLTALFGRVVHIPDPHPDDASLAEAATATIRAMAEGAPVIYQGCFHHPLPARGRIPVAFHGRADFLIRSDLDPATGGTRADADPDEPWTYEPWDTKLARRPGPGAVVQLAAYADAVAVATGRTPRRMHLLTGDGHTHSLDTTDFTPILGTVTGRLLTSLATDPTLPSPTWGPPRPSCEGCGYSAWCSQGRTAARHLSLVAGLRTDQAAKLADVGITTIDALAEADDEHRPPTLPRRSFEQLRAQACLQVRQDTTRTPDNPQGTVTAEVFSHDGLAGLPAPATGDVFFDMEGYPYHSREGGRGLEYLFGATTEDEHGAETFHTFWAHDRAQEKKALEDFVDFVCARVDADPDAHVYHYASYEVDRLKHLSSEFATREEEVNRLLREHRLVDLYTVVRKSLRVSQRSYSIKYLEPLYLPAARSGGVTTATSSIDAYAAHLAAAEAGDHDEAARVLADIAAYNRDDCHSTARLRDWLEEHRTLQGITERPVVQLELTEAEAERARKRAERLARQAAITGPLLEELPEDPALRTEEDVARASLAALVGYYQRENLPPWREHHRRTNAPLTDLETDTDCAVPWRVRAGEWIEPTGRQRKARRELDLRLDTSHPHPFTTGQDVHLLYPGAPGQPATAAQATVTDARPDALTIVETCDADVLHFRHPVAVLPGSPVNPAPKDGALELVAGRALEDLPAWPRHAGLDLLRRIPPRLDPPGPLPDPADHDGDLIAATIAAVDRLDGSYLAVQGPPGAGKTYLAGRLITHLARQGKSVGVCSTSHKAVENVMSAALRAAEEAGVELAAAKRAKSKKDADPDLPWDQPTTPQALAGWRTGHTAKGRPVLIGGTAWAMANATMVADPVDVLIIDEAGQFALADTLAVSASARNLVLLGDPQQLPQVVQGTHGEGADASALQHLMGGRQIIDPARGYFLDQTRRMHPAVCAPVSDLSYQGRLHAHPTTALRGLTVHEPGLYAHVVDHRGRTTHSPEEVDAVVAIATSLVADKVTTGPDAAPRPLTGHDILVVAPYNLQVRALRRALARAAETDPALEGIRVGTVDRFQGQEAPAVICSMTTSDAAETSRGTAFVLDRNRLNVALSRAQSAAVLVHSPHLAATAPRSIEELRLLASFTRLSTAARPWPDHR
ncbi:TM0106 family RecB-like putative nuclease [Nocardiopsis lambiniae]|uniref:TM0106 family RecB-like putative nuclease n=1 Tax=Nocardiopsis lambiniae TaxID=3075539 RepID=A0ABU2MHD7_9ACTN|nr:TM0106 family RecB-like putative nuclease [Nocardiopsis sp. DSM 44743]MDT0331945.1 TM0106 family RecB-like putative nuclease [Nocardiopsis sp. DSM 44743]